MPTILKSINLSYFPVPKCACSSLKIACYNVENENQYDLSFAGRPSIHNIYPSTGFDSRVVESTKDLHRVAVVRDPISRLLSAYGNRIIHHKALERFGGMVELGLNPKPNLGEYLISLGSYRAACHEIRHHTDHYTYFLGPTRDFYRDIFDISETERFYELLEKKSGKKIMRHKTQRNGPKFSMDDIGTRALRAAIEYCEPDYKFLKLPVPKTGIFGWRKRAYA